MRSLLKDKKGDVSDSLIILIIIAFLAISFIIVLFINSKLSNIISETALVESDAGETIVSSFNYLNSTVVQQGFVLMFGIMVIFVIATSFLVRVHPVFIFLYIFISIITVLVAVFISMFYERIQENAELAMIISQQPMINWIMGNIVLITMAIGGLSMIIIFSKIFDVPVGRGDFG